MLRHLALVTLMIAGSVSYGKCDQEHAEWKHKQDRLESKKTVRLVTGVGGFFFWPLWIGTAMSHSKVSRLKKEANQAEVNYKRCMER